MRTLLFKNLMHGPVTETAPAPDEAGLADYRGRIERYMQKAVREAKARTSWISPNEEYENALLGFVRALLGRLAPNPFLEDLRAQAEPIDTLTVVDELLSLSDDGDRRAHQVDGGGREHRGQREWIAVDPLGGDRTRRRTAAPDRLLRPAREVGAARLGLAHAHAEDQRDQPAARVEGSRHELELVAPDHVTGITASITICAAIAPSATAKTRCQSFR